MKKRFGSYTVEGNILCLLLIIEYLLRIFLGILKLFKKRRGKIKEAAVERIRKILVVEIVGMGDAVIATSIVRPLRSRYTKAKITFLGNPQYMDAVRGAFDATTGLEAPWVRKKSKLRWLQGWGGFIQNCRRLRSEKFDLCIDARCDWRSGFLCYLIGAENRIGFDFSIGSYFFTEAVPYGAIVQRAEEYAKILYYLGIDTSLCIPFVRISPQIEANIEVLLTGLGLSKNNYYLVHPGAARKYKKYPLGKLKEIIEGLRGKYPGIKPLVIGGEEDAEDLACLKAISEGELITLTTTIEEAMGLTAFCQTLICNNSGLMHIAAALGKKAVVFIGPTDERIWSPSGEGHLLFQESRGLDCHPCGEEICVRPDSPCIELIEPHSVVAAICRSGILFENSSPPPVVSGQ